MPELYWESCVFVYVMHFSHINMQQRPKQWWNYSNIHRHCFYWNHLRSILAHFKFGPGSNVIDALNLSTHNCIYSFPIFIERNDGNKKEKQDFKHFQWKLHLLYCAVQWYDKSPLLVRTSFCCKLGQKCVIFSFIFFIYSFVFSCKFLMPSL